AFSQRSTERFVRFWRYSACGCPKPVNAPQNARPESDMSPVVRSTRSEIERCSAVLAVGDVLEDEPIALFDTRFRSPSCRQLERADGMSRGGDAPGCEAVPDADDRAVLGEEDDVDRKAHEEHVYGAGPVDEHPAARLEPVAAEQAAGAPERAVGHLT